jgi:hypothetical protein
MEQLSKTQQEGIKKASTERLRVNLLKADYAEEEVMRMSREELMDTWAKVLALGGGATAAPKAVGYDLALEKERLEFEKYRFETEMKAKEAELALQGERQAKDAELQLTLQREKLELEKSREELTDTWAKVLALGGGATAAPKAVGYLSRIRERTSGI